MESELLEIHDKDKSTEGGAPGWMVWAIVFVAFLAIAGVAAILFAVFTSLG